MAAEERRNESGCSLSARDGGGGLGGGALGRSIGFDVAILAGRLPRPPVFVPVAELALGC